MSNLLYRSMVHAVAVAVTLFRKLGNLPTALLFECESAAEAPKWGWWPGSTKAWT